METLIKEISTSHDAVEGALYFAKGWFRSEVRYDDGNTYSSDDVLKLLTAIAEKGDVSIEN
jgi:hypothetical protein